MKESELNRKFYEFVDGLIADGLTFEQYVWVQNLQRPPITPEATLEIEAAA